MRESEELILFLCRRLRDFLGGGDCAGVEEVGGTDVGGVMLAELPACMPAQVVVAGRADFCGDSCSFAWACVWSLREVGGVVVAEGFCRCWGGLWWALGRLLADCNAWHHVHAFHSACNVPFRRR